MTSFRGLYIHIPFCVSRCDYCAFATWAGAEARIDDYVEALLGELRWRRSKGELSHVDSLYIGGGTPSVIPARLIARAISEISFSSQAEVTIECNPESTTSEGLMIYRDSGVNRISLGLQSFSKEVLRSLGRDYEPTAILRAVDSIGKAGIEDYSVDLIFGAAAETISTLEESIKKVLELSPAPSHVSAYALTVEKNTPLARDGSRHPNEDYQADAYQIIDAMLARAGMEWYEISNWSMPGHYSRHNWNYWMQGEYIGAGCSAHSHLDSKRSWNIFNLSRYLSAVSGGGDPVAGSEEIRPQEKRLEALELLLRTCVGVPTRAIRGFEEIEPLCFDSGGTTTLTLKGRLLANQVALRLDPSLVGTDELEKYQRLDPVKAKNVRASQQSGVTP